MSNLIIEKLLSKVKRTDLPAFGPGDTVRVQVKIKEGDKERLQAFEGVVIARSRGPQASFTVRKMSFGQGVERIFPENSGVIDKVDLVRSSKVRRAKLYYLRGLRGKAARLKDVEREQEQEPRLDMRLHPAHKFRRQLDADQIVRQAHGDAQNHQHAADDDDAFDEDAQQIPAQRQIAMNDGLNQ